MTTAKKKTYKDSDFRFLDFEDVQASDFDEAGDVYKLVEAISKQHHEHDDLRIVIGWNLKGGDGVGEIKILDQKLRQVCRFDVVLTLNRDNWSAMTPQLRKAGVDHLLTHVRKSIDSNDEPRRIGFGAPGQLQATEIRDIYVRREPPTGEFGEILQRHGI